MKCLHLLKDQILNLYFSNVRKVYTNKDSDLVQSTVLYKKSERMDCGHANHNYDDVSSYDYDGQDGEGLLANYENIQYKIKEIKAHTYNIKLGEKKTLLNRAEETQNLPATASQVFNQAQYAPTIYSSSPEILSSGKFFVQKGAYNVFNIWMPVRDLIDNVAATDLINSLGISSQENSAMDKDTFIEFKCEIESINLVSNKKMGLAA